MTVENIEVKRVDVEAGVIVVIEHVAGCIDVGPGVDGELHLGEISEGAVLHAPREPQEVPKAVGGLPRRHVWMVPMADVDDTATSVNFAADGNEIIGGGPGLIESVWGRIGSVGGSGGEREQR